MKVDFDADIAGLKVDFDADLAETDGVSTGPASPVSDEDIAQDIMKHDYTAEEIQTKFGDRVESTGASQEELDVMPITNFELLGEMGTKIKEHAVGTAQGAAATGLGILRLGGDVIEAAGGEPDMTWTDSNIKALNKSIRAYEEEHGLGKGEISAADFGRFIPTLATLGLSTASKMAVPMIEGLVAYAEQRGAEKDKAASALTGGLTSLGVYGTGVVLDALLPPTAKAIQKHLQVQNDLSDEVVEDIFKNYQKIMKVPDTTASRVKAIVNSLGESGKKFIEGAKQRSPRAAAELQREAVGRTRLIEELGGAVKTISAKSKQPFEDLTKFSQGYAKAEKAIMDNYTLMKDMMPHTALPKLQVIDATDVTKSMTSKAGRTATTVREKVTDASGQAFTTTKNIVDVKGKPLATTEKIVSATKKPLKIPVLDEAFTTTRAEVKSRLSGELTPHNLIDTIKMVGDLKFATKDKIAKNSLNTLQETLQGVLKENIDPALYNMYRLQKNQYSHMLSMREHVIGKTANLVKTEALAPKEALQALRQMGEGGKATFEAVERVAGSDVSSAFEKALIRDAIDNASGKGSGDFLHFSDLNNILMNKEFVSAEGKAFQELTSTLDRTFATDDLIRSIMHNTQNDVSLSPTLIGKAKFFIVQQAWPAVRQRIPFLEKSKHALKTARLESLLTRPALVKTAKEVMADMPEYQKAMIQADTVDFIKEILTDENLKNVMSRAAGQAEDTGVTGVIKDVIE